MDQLPSPTVDAVGELLRGKRWLRNPDFGPYLRRHREDCRLSLGIAGSFIGISRSGLAKWERGQVISQPKCELLAAFSDAYRLDPRELVAMAGFGEIGHSPVEVGAQLEQEFANLLLRPSLRPPMLNKKALPFIAPQVKRQWIDFALKLERYLALEGALTVGELLAGLERSAATAADEPAGDAGRKPGPSGAVSHPDQKE